MLLPDDVWQQILMFVAPCSFILTCRKYYQKFGGPVRLVHSAIVFQDTKALRASTQQLLPLGLFSTYTNWRMFARMEAMYDVKLYVVGECVRNVFMQYPNLTLHSSLLTKDPPVMCIVACGKMESGRNLFKALGGKDESIWKYIIPENCLFHIPAPNLCSTTIPLSFGWVRNKESLGDFFQKCSWVSAAQIVAHGPWNSPALDCTPAFLYSMQTGKAFMLEEWITGSVWSRLNQKFYAWCGFTFVLPLKK